MVIAQVLQTKSSQFVKLVLMPEHHLCNQLRQLRHAAR